MIGVINHLLSIVFTRRFHYHSRKMIGSLGFVYRFEVVFAGRFVDTWIEFSNLGMTCFCRTGVWAKRRSYCENLPKIIGCDDKDLL